MGAFGNDRECFEPPTWAAEPVPGTSLTIISPHVSGETYPPNPVEPVTVPLDTKSFYVFGRNADLCDIHLAHGSASRIHAALVHHSNKRLYLIDLGATHGTTVDGKRAEKHKPVHVHDRARLSFGSLTTQFEVRCPTIPESKSAGGTKRKSDSGHKESSSRKLVKDDGQTVQCSHILVKHKDSRKPSSHKEAVITRTKEEAEKMVLKFRHDIIKASNVQKAFAEYAQRESHCSSWRRGGDVGKFGRNKMQPPFEEAAFALKIGDLSDAVFSDSGVHIILRVG
mmetsp:Transcript_48159/g.92058  ORF Transcript_48159/g.92058 Transcript_48159/m.92058 type:complete len:282 (-) Transcript_48159:120-965(-)